MYRLTSTESVVRLSDGVSIPPDPENRDRQEYVAWLEIGNEPLPAEAEPGPTPQEQIEALEREHMLPKATREFMLTFMEATAIEQGAGLGLTAEQALAALRQRNPGYQKVKALDEQIDALRVAQ